jgi:colanic acid/amylovoran biosynthesis glycosyltransferase
MHPNDPVRVLVLTSTFPRRPHDTEPRFVLDLCERLAESFEVVVLAPSAVGAAKTEWFGKVKVIRYRYAPVRRWERLAAPGAIMPNIRQEPILALLVPFLIIGQLYELFRLLKQESFDVIHCNWIIPQGFVLALVSCFIRTPPAVLTCLGGDVYVLNRWPFSGIKKWVLRTFNRITVITSDITGELQRLAGSAALPPIRHIPMGVDLGHFSSAPRDGTSDGKLEVLFVGRLAEKKGVGHLLAALKDPRLRERTDYKVTIVGDGPLRRQLEAQAADPALGGRVSFPGALSHEELGPRLGSAHVLCAPFVVARDGDRDGMPAVIMEAAASGLPIIASDIGGVRDIVETGVTGWLLASGDISALTEAILDALDHPDTRAALGLEIARRARSYSWDAIAEMYAEELTSAMAGGVAAHDVREVHGRADPAG